MTHFGLRMAAVFLSAGLLGCDPPEEEFQPQEGERPGVDMDAESGLDMNGERPETAPDAGLPPRPATPEFEIPTDTPETGTDGAEVPEIDLNAPPTEGSADQESGEVEVPELDLNPPSTEGAAVTEEEGSDTLPDVDPGS